MTAPTEPPEGVSRRALIAGSGAVLGVAALGTTAVVVSQMTHGEADHPAFGANQAGIARPQTPQKQGLISIFDFADRDQPGFADALRERLALISAAIATCTSTTGFDAGATPDGPGDLTVTIGLGPRAVAAVDPGLPGAADLPLFAGDELIAAADRGGDLLVAVYTSDATVLQAVVDRVTRDVEELEPRWQQAGHRAAGHGTVTRNPLGFKDGVIVPHGDAELDENVWIADGPAAGGTVCVIRRLRLRVDDFRGETITRQGEIIGRHKVDGSPLSGGGPDDPIDVNAKTASGELLIPARAHVRAAHPSFTGSALMLRRGYAFDNGSLELADGSTVDDQGLLFICFQRDLDTFVKTQLRIDELDDLRAYTTTTASAAFLVLPGFTASKPLGAGLLG